jgi:hypothetical protein
MVSLAASTAMALVNVSHASAVRLVGWEQPGLLDPAARELYVDWDEATTSLVDHRSRGRCVTQCAQLAGPGLREVGVQLLEPFAVVFFELGPQ